MAAPTSALTFSDLILEVAIFRGVAYYGADGDAVAQIPTDAHDLAECKRHVNNGIRRFFNDAPKTGWRFVRSVLDFSVFGSVAQLAGRTVSGGAHDVPNNETILTATAAVFYPGMEYRTISIETDGDFQIKRYISETQVAVVGDASAVAAKLFAVEMEGNFTLPANFGGSYTGQITYAADTNEGISLKWHDEAAIRQWRENVTDETGDPWMAAIRPMSDALAKTARRWELMLYPAPDETMVIQFPYDIHFDALVNLTDVPPVPYHHDETIRKACLAAAEQDGNDQASDHQLKQYDKQLANSHNIDNRSGPRRLGYFGNPERPEGSPIKAFRDNWYDRPTVEYS